MLPNAADATRPSLFHCSRHARGIPRWKKMPNLTVHTHNHTHSHTHASRRAREPASNRKTLAHLANNWERARDPWSLPRARRYRYVTEHSEPTKRFRDSFRPTSDRYCRSAHSRSTERSILFRLGPTIRVADNAHGPRRTSTLVYARRRQTTRDDATPPCVAALAFRVLWAFAELTTLSRLGSI